MGQPQGDNGTLPVSIAAERDSGTMPVSPPRGDRLGVRPRGPVGRDGYEVDAMICAPA